MKQLGKILAPTEFSKFSKVGVRYALTLAKAVGSEVIVYHVVDFEERVDYADLMEAGKKMKRNASDEGSAKVLLRMLRTAFDDYGEARAARSYYAPIGTVKAAKQALRQFLQDNFSDLLSGLKVCEKVELGKGQDRIVEEAKKQPTDVIVMSTHGRSALAHVLRGSVTEHVIRNAPCPVVAIGPESVEKMQEKLVAA
jgi:nucleotide-binding universal stress UspA family protein